MPIPAGGTWSWHSVLGAFHALFRSPQSPPSAPPPSPHSALSPSPAPRTRGRGFISSPAPRARARRRKRERAVGRRKRARGRGPKMAAKTQGGIRLSAVSLRGRRGRGPPGGDHPRGQLAPARCHGQGQLPAPPAAQSPVQAGLGHFQGHSLSEGGERRLVSPGGTWGFPSLLPAQIL